MKYLTLQICREKVFPHIHRVLTDHEPAQTYEREPTGIAELEKIMQFM